ncbi:nicotinate phosphoribosyltransferase [Nadsonia fulvescens var. elongata DSM 6958]|uniref:Nicotinate phosphoribosyltransferase n=1 Tax=Nadsonia fulvescens var. elongata DSM 6958 TaxID=857566 RepID=A0A1E3PPP3_9ASCO|nr:nicotinate phosphoribosyltransferase [Nadsonia fulvescens var. elongata DSM 6958]
MTLNSEYSPVIVSLLDTDLYKLTMQAVVFDHFRDANVSYAFKNRSPEKKLNKKAVEWLQFQINSLKNLRYSSDEIEFLQSQVPFFHKDFIDYLRKFKVDPEHQVSLSYDEIEQEINIAIEGPWIETIIYEIPILALVSEAYFKFVDTQWSYDEQFELASHKCEQLIAAGCPFSEFGTRRRRSYLTQDTVIKGIIAAAKNSPNSALFTGTSNVHFARNYGLKPTGTVAHEWMMGVAASTNDYLNANRLAMELWLKTVGNSNAGVALTDTFGTDAFLKDFIPPFSDIYAGVRQDSGDPEEYTEKIGQHYRKLGYPAGSKLIIYSDSLNIERCIQYKAVAERNGLRAAFGVGTFFTNDFYNISDNSIKSTPMNIVIKLSSLNGKPAIKISDNLGKNMGDPETVFRVKKELGYIDRSWKDGDELHRWDK